MYLSKAVRAIQPILSYFTYRFHVEKAREHGIRVEDMYCQKFFKEPYIHHHVYAQHFHPETLLDRVRSTHFFRQPRRLFKGFTAPDWAQSHRNGYDYDLYSRKAWENAWEDMKAEWTPMQFLGTRQDPNLIQMFRFEQFGRGYSSKLFYNETPNPTWFRHGGHLDNKEKNLYSFKWAYQNNDVAFGIDTTTPEGRAQFKEEWDRMCEMCPELLSREDMIYPHQHNKVVSSEPHFQRMWQHYRNWVFKSRFSVLVEDGTFSEEEARAVKGFLDMTGTPTVNLYIYAKLGHLEHLQNDDGFKATQKMFNALNLNLIEFNTNSAQPYEEQFWEQFDAVFQLTEDTMRQELPYFVTDPTDLDKVNALFKNESSQVAEETTARLS